MFNKLGSIFASKILSFISKFISCFSLKFMLFIRDDKKKENINLYRD